MKTVVDQEDADLETAKSARDAAELKYFGENSHA